MTIPITILTGFLGSGKTTLLNHALRSPLLSRALVVVNELGAVPLDHLLVKEIKEDVVLLDSGCVCCSIRGDLVDALVADAEAGADAFDRVLVETTGMADPTPIVSTLVRHPLLTQYYHLDAVVTAVDGQNGAHSLARHAEARKQALLADDLVLTKADVVGAEALADTRAKLTELNPQARVFVSELGQLDWEPILRWTPSTVATRLDVVLPEEQSLQEAHGASEVRTFSVRVDAAVDFPAVAMWMSMMTQLHGEHVLRVKGLLRVADEAGPLVIQAVQHVVYPVYAMAKWPSEDRSSRLMIITRGMTASLVDSLRRSLEEVVGLSALDATVH